MTPNAPTEPGMGDRLESWLREHTRASGPWLIGFAILLGLQISPLWYATPDALLYLSMARRLAAGGPLTALGNSQLALPPGYSLLLSPAFWTGPHPFLAVALFQWTMTLIFIFGVYRWMRRQARDGAVLLTGLVMLHVSLWIHYRRALSEVAFMALMMWTVIAADAALTSRSRQARILRTLLVSIALLALCLIREVGLVLAGGFALAALGRAARGGIGWGAAIALTLLAALPCAAGVIAFARYDAAMKAAASSPMGTHLDGVRAAIAGLDENALEGLRVRVSEIGRVVIPGMFKAYGRPHDWFEPSMLVYLPVFILAAWGWWLIVRARMSVLALTFPLYLGAHLLWPFDAGTRYVLPMLPMVWACIWTGIAPLRHARLTLLAVLLAVHLAVATGYWLAIDRPRARVCAAEWPVVDTLATTIGGGNAVVGPGVRECVQLMIELSLDRRAPRADTLPPLDLGVQWIVTTQSETPPGFVPRLSAGAYQLLGRESPS